MKITAIAPWFGSKRTLAPRIVAELGEHSAYWDVFCGGMSVLMQKPPSGHEHVNDLHGDLINLAHVIRDVRLGSTLYRRLRRTLMHEEIHAEAKAFCECPATSTPDVDRAYWFFVWSWFGRNGVSGTAACNNTSFARRFTPHGGHGGKRFSSAVESIPAWRERLRRVTILRMDGFELIPRIDDAPGTAIYLDPPYLVKGAKYVHDFTDADHEHLAVEARRFKRARVVVSYYDHPRLVDLYSGWTIRRIDVTKALCSQGMRGKRKADGGAPPSKATECLILNGPSYESGMELFNGDKATV